MRVVTVCRPDLFKQAVRKIIADRHKSRSESSSGEKGRVLLAEGRTHRAKGRVLAAKLGVLQVKVRALRIEFSPLRINFRTLWLVPRVLS
jgi:hypothetical protein